MPFKKGDIVEITEEDSWGEHNYDIGTQWLVVDTTHLFVIVKDDRQHDGKGIIVKFRVKLIEEENKMLKFKEGQTYICTESHGSQWTEGKEYKVYFNNNTHAFALSDNNLTLWYEDELNEGQHKFKLKEETETTDLIDNQPYYKKQGIEPIHLMRRNFTKEEFVGFLQGNVLKYMLRYKDKNGVEDLKKAKTYLTWLIEEEEE